MQLPKLGLVLFTFGNVSAVDRERGVFAIKPSGVPYDELTPYDIVICDYDARVVEGTMRPFVGYKNPRPALQNMGDNWRHFSYPQYARRGLGAGGNGYSDFRDNPRRSYPPGYSLRSRPDRRDDTG